jgi:DNA-binding GntR family transcriptional regulator
MVLMSTHPRPRRDGVADTLRNQILSGVLPAGTRLREEQIAADLGVSRVPVREALLGLEQEGYLVIRPRRGAVVATPSPTRALEVMEIRRSLEVLAARRAAVHRGGAVAAEFEDLMAWADAAITEHDHDGMPELIDRFHELVAIASGNEALVELLEQLRSRVRWMFEVDLEHRSHTQWADHAEILDAILAGDAETAAARMDEHVARDESLYQAMVPAPPP